MAYIVCVAMEIDTCSCIVCVTMAIHEMVFVYVTMVILAVACIACVTMGDTCSCIVCVIMAIHVKWLFVYVTMVMH